MDHFFPEIDKEADLASFFAPVKDRIQKFFQSREKKRAASRVEGFHKAEDKDWDGFTDNLARKSFVKQLGSDPRSDPKLLRYADSMNRLKTGKELGTVQGKRGTYKIVKLRGSDRLGCTCNDWRYKKSVAQPGEQVDCKHIRQFQQQKTAGLKRLSPTPTEREEWNKRVEQAELTNGDGASLMKTPEGFAAYTHRSRSKFYPSPSAIPLGKIRSVAKTAGHVDDRISERVPGAELEVAKIKLGLRGRKLRPGATYYVPLERGRGWVVIGDVGGRHVVKTVLGPNMRPPGERLSMTKKARAPRDYKREYAEYHAKPEQRKNRSLRNQARRKLGLRKGDPREVDHKQPLSKGGGNGHRNLRAVSLSSNRSKADRGHDGS